MGISGYFTRKEIIKMTSTEYLRPFQDIEDPFNKGNYLTGQINIESGSSYGSLILSKINSEDKETLSNQYIHATPKMYYPFNRNGDFKFYKTPTISPAYVKYDGTNILAFYYKHTGSTFVTYKTRLTPILRESKFGDFLAMWLEILNKYPRIPEIVQRDKVNLSFEMYGIVNKHLILYPVRLDCKLLFGVGDDGNIILPGRWENELPIAEKYQDFTPDQDFIAGYSALRQHIESTNENISETEIKGSEGSIIYIDLGGGWKQWKCKPESVFRIHTKSLLSKNSIMATCYNALENVSLEELTYGFVYDLLKEEFREIEIQMAETRIKIILNEVKEEVVKRYTIIDIYNKIGLSLKTHKKSIMRELSKHLEKKDMRYAYTILKAYENK